MSFVPLIMPTELTCPGYSSVNIDAIESPGRIPSLKRSVRVQVQTKKEEERRYWIDSEDTWEGR